MLSELKQIMTFLIGLLQRFRIWISDGVERRVRRNILDKDSNIILIGTGVHHAISDTERAIGGKVFSEQLFDPFTIDPSSGWICEASAMDYVEECKGLVDERLVLGAQLVAAIYGLRAIAEAESIWIAKRARRSLTCKVDLANEALRAFRENAQALEPQPQRRVA
jgi:hypothetical protein